MDTWRLLGESLSRSGALWSFGIESLDVCYAQGTNAVGLIESGHGVCTHDFHCRYEACTEDQPANLPSYSAAVANVEDIQQVVAFANTHNISVSIKTTGHSYAGSSTMKGSLLIWMAEFQKYGNVGPHTDSCGSTVEHVLKIGGGQVWGEAYQAVKNAGGRDIVGGDAPTVSAAGGWLMGGGLSALSRLYGYGVDNVLALDVVLADASAATVDACSHPDLFWALRGGGGGSFGVVTAAHYRTHLASPVFVLTVNILGVSELAQGYYQPLVASWIDVWVDNSPYLDRRWSGGYWSLGGVEAFWFRGSEADARATFVDVLDAWKASMASSGGESIAIKLFPFQDYISSRLSGCGFWNSETPACQRYEMPEEPTGYNNFGVGSRMVPRDWVTGGGGAAAKQTLKWMAQNGGLGHTFNYYLGGAVSDVAPNATAVHPSVRTAIWNLQVFTPELIQKAREAIPESGVCYNHAAKDEPDWNHAAWGTNLPRLLEVKAAYDPANRFNCYHCVGYQRLGPDELTPASCEGEYSCAGSAASDTPLGTIVVPSAAAGAAVLLVAGIALARSLCRRQQGPKTAAERLGDSTP